MTHTHLFVSAIEPTLPSSHRLSLLRALRDLLLIRRLLPLLDKRQERRLPWDVFPQHLRDIEALWSLIVFEDTAKRALSRAD
jgi:hypothetical protein